MINEERGRRSGTGTGPIAQSQTAHLADAQGEGEVKSEVGVGHERSDDRLKLLDPVSKSHGPDLRLAAVTGPDDVMGTLGQLRQLGQGWSSRLLQRLLLSLLTEPQAVAAVGAARDEYARRRATFCDTLRRHGIETLGSDGLNVWVPVVDEAAALMRLSSLGIGVAPGRPFTVLPDETGHIRVTVGLLDRDVENVAIKVAEAAVLGGRRGRAR